MSTAERKVKEKEQRRNAIVGVAARLFFTRSYEDITMDDIAKEAQLAKGTLYLYFKNKDSIYTAVIIRSVEILNRMMREAASRKKRGVDRTYATGVAYYEFYKRYPSYFNAMMDAATWGPKDIGKGVADELTCKGMDTMKIIEDAIREGIADGTIRPDVEPRKTAMFLAHSTWAMIKLPADPVPRDEIVEFTLDMLKRAIENK